MLASPVGTFEAKGAELPDKFAGRGLLGKGR